MIENSVSGESRRGGEDKVLDDLEKVVSKIYEDFFLFFSFYSFFQVVLKIYEKCVGENEACISTIDMLHHIEVRMETLTQEQEVLHPQKVGLEIQRCMNASKPIPRWSLRGLRAKRSDATGRRKLVSRNSG